MWYNSNINKKKKGEVFVNYPTPKGGGLLAYIFMKNTKMTNNTLQLNTFNYCGQPNSFYWSVNFVVPTFNYNRNLSEKEILII